MLRSLGYIRLNKVTYDPRARDGTWCTLPYPLHKKGCPNFPKCPESKPDFNKFKECKWVAVVEEFDLKAHAEKMRGNSVDRRNQALQLYKAMYHVESDEDVLRIAKEKGVRIPNIWSDKQCRNVYYWQNSVGARLLKKAQRICFPIYGDVILDLPEASGVNLFDTMSLHGIELKTNPDHVYKIMLVGKHQ